ncbi:MAG: hypothetical protein IPH07_16290 [Deltaproteobacteria bacterium]|nr:hypothetical protein [Deltaproteobacteria bacterium]MBK8719588.1 hypothetical protein [Deltaproteobacteria bacterium]MBP7291482.1 hypothetical protein [Nannocystaceae bacterium]
MTSAIPWLLWSALAPAPATDPIAAALELRWQAPAPCPDRSALTHAITALATVEPTVVRSRASIDARVEPHVDGFALQLRVEAEGRTRTRTLVAAKCSSLLDAVAIEAALLLEAAHAATPRATAIHGEVAIIAGTVRLARRPRPQLRLRGSASLGGAVIEGASAGYGGGVVVNGRRWGASLEAVHWPRGFAPLAARTSAGTTLRQTDVIASGCARHAHGRVGASLCIGAAIGARQAGGRGLVDGREAVAATFALVLAPAFEWQTPSPIVVAIAPWVRAAIVRPGVRVDGLGELARPRTWAFGGALRLEFSLWPPARGRGRRARRSAGGELRRTRDGFGDGFGGSATLTPEDDTP